VITAGEFNRFSMQSPFDWLTGGHALPAAGLPSVIAAGGHPPEGGSGYRARRLSGSLQGGGKRCFDLVLGLLLFCLTLPLLLCAMLAIWLESLGRAPVIYRQQRVGLHGRPITILKLRTMRVDAERNGPRTTLDNDPRVTLLGRLLRRFRIDELPQLVNVLRGEMSLVGPRPERPEFVAQYQRQINGYSQRHSVKPGLTGLAQICQGYTDDAEGALIKLSYDLIYIRRSSLVWDLLIVLWTFPVTFTGQGAR